MLFLLTANLIFGSLWFIVNLVPHMRVRLRGTESVWEVIAVTVQINYCCFSVFDKAGRCKGGSLSYAVLPAEENETIGQDEGDNDGVGKEHIDESDMREEPYDCNEILKMVCIGTIPCFYP